MSTTTPITERVKGYKDACKVLERTPLTLEQFQFLPQQDQQAMFSLHKITTVIEALNEGVVFDWNDYDQYKYYPWFDMETYDGQPAGSGFAFDYCGYAGTFSSVGARLCLPSKELAKYVGKLMLEDYKHWMKK